MARFNLGHEERIGVCLTEKQRKKTPGKINSINQHRGKKVWIIGRESRRTNNIQESLSIRKNKAFIKKFTIRN